MRATLRIWPLRSLSGAIGRRTTAPPDHPLDYSVDEPSVDEDTTMQRHQEPAR